MLSYSIIVKISFLSSLSVPVCFVSSGLSVLRLLAAENRVARYVFVGYLGLFSAVASAEADGPDFYKVRNVDSDDVLNMRAKPHWRAEKIGEIPADGRCIRNLGCRGGLTYDEFVNLNELEQKQVIRHRPRWCRVEYKGVTAWVAARYLAEGSCQKNGANEPDKANIDPSNTTYLIENVEVTLVAGSASLPVAGSSSHVETQLIASVYADINNDNLRDAIAVLSHHSGGSGTFFYLAAVTGGDAPLIPALFVGDRIKVNHISVDDGRIMLNYLDREDGQPMAASPAVPVQRVFIIRELRWQEIF